MATMSENMTEADIEAFENYAWSLPVTYSEEITAKPRLTVRARMSSTV